NNYNNSNSGISTTPRSLYLPLTVIGIALALLIGYILDIATDSTVPWADGATTALSIMAMWMLARKYTEQWLVWIAADVASAWLYWYKDLWLTGGLYMIYAIIAWFGYKKWKSI
ncbi:MAG: nicotinamide riboside transporter PnuC, partial [Muribaculaceae bacterium]|nr:nicotinamide riboside transporter PnuC [Muribaculaceae bacterium]